MEDPTISGAPTSADAPPPRPASPSANEPGVPAPTAPGGAQPSASLTDAAKQTLASALDGRKGAAADAIERLADTVERSGEQFEGTQDWIASAIGRGAAELGALADTLRDKDLGEIVVDVQAFARRQPALFIGTALAAGFAVARLAKVVAGDLSRDDLPSVPEVGRDRD